VLFVSPKQYDGEVQAALASAGRIGKRYYLAYHGPTMPQRANPELVVDGQVIQQYFPSQTDEFTEIRSL
jgi:DNA sulfur modification protein DndD